MKRTVFVLTLALCLASASALWAAGDPNFEFRVMPPTSTVADSGGVAALSIQLTTKNVDTQGWSFGVKLTNDVGVTSKIKFITFGPGLLTTNDGGQVGFSSTSFFILPDVKNKVNDCGKPRDSSGAKWDGINCNDPANPINADALTNGGVVDMGAIVLLPPTANLEILGIQVQAAGAVGSFATAEFTGEFGDPATPTVVVYNGASLAPGVADPAKIGFQSCGAAPSDFTVDVAGGGGNTDAEVTSGVAVNFNKNSGHAGAAIAGWSYGLCVKEPAKLEILGAVDAADTAGATPDVSLFNVESPAGLTRRVTVDAEGVVTIPAQNDWSDLLVTYKVKMTAEGESCHVTLCDNLGTPTIHIRMVIGGFEVTGALNEGISPATECCNPDACNRAGKFEFRSTFTMQGGNANGDRKMDIADGIYLLNYLFRSGPPLACECAGDANGDKALDGSDAVMIIMYQFELGPPPVRGPGCVLVSPADCGALTCETPTATCQ